MSNRAGRVCALTMAGVIGWGATACSSGDSGSGSSPRAPVANDRISASDVEAALDLVDREFRGCRSLTIDVMGGSTVVRPGTAEGMVRVRGRSRLTRQAARPDADAVVVVLRALDMFLVEPGHGRPVAFNDAAEVMLREARAAGDGCGASATERYRYQAPRTATTGSRVHPLWSSSRMWT